MPRRASWDLLDGPAVAVGVLEEDEAELTVVEVLGAVNVRDRHDDDLQCPVHRDVLLRRGPGLSPNLPFAGTIGGHPGDQGRHHARFPCRL